jgi:hypothetical protein
MSAAIRPGAESRVLPVCPESDLVTIIQISCGHCNQLFAKSATNKKKRFCSTSCRVNASRLPHRDKRRRWDEARNFYKTQDFDGRRIGPIKNVGPLASFVEETA